MYSHTSRTAVYHKGKKAAIKSLEKLKCVKEWLEHGVFQQTARGRTAAKPKRQSQQKAKKNSCSPRVQGAG